jgi:hypothetical protein
VRTLQRIAVTHSFLLLTAPYAQAQLPTDPEQRARIRHRTCKRYPPGKAIKVSTMSEFFTVSCFPPTSLQQNGLRWTSRSADCRP